MLPHYLAKLSGQLYTKYIHISENNMLNVRLHLFHESLFVYLFFLPILTSL